MSFCLVLFSINSPFQLELKKNRFKNGNSTGAGLRADRNLGKISWKLWQISRVTPGTKLASPARSFE